MARLLLILMLVWQPLALQAVGAPASLASMSDAMGCCKIVETVSCCGKPVIEPVCSMTGGACNCDAAPTQPEQPTPALPGSNSAERALATLSFDATSVAIVPLDSRLAKAGMQERPVRSHNTIQAVLGIWRT